MTRRKGKLIATRIGEKLNSDVERIAKDEGIDKSEFNRNALREAVLRKRSRRVIVRLSI